MSGFLSFVIVFGLLIFVHELGHFTAAKLCGVPVKEFGFGYPPKLLTLGYWRETEITINALPLGGFVNMSEDDPDAPGSLANKNWKVRAFVFAAGALMNLVLAIVLYSITFMTGALTPIETEPGAGIYYVVPQSPASAAELRTGDNILAINSIDVTDAEAAADLIQSNAGTEIVLDIEREGEMLAPISLVPRVDPPPNAGAMGVSLGPSLERVSYPVWEAIPLGARTTWRAVSGMYSVLLEAIRGETSFEVSGPIGIYKTTTEVAKTGWERLIEFAAFLSINLFLVNLLPLPALDGGRLIFVLLEVIRHGRRIAPEKEGMVHAVGMAMLLVFMAVVTYFDYQRYFG